MFKKELAYFLQVDTLVGFLSPYSDAIPLLDTRTRQTNLYRLVIAVIALIPWSMSFSMLWASGMSSPDPTGIAILILCGTTLKQVQNKSTDFSSNIKG